MFSINEHCTFYGHAIYWRLLWSLALFNVEARVMYVCLYRYACSYVYKCVCWCVFVYLYVCMDAGNPIHVLHLFNWARFENNVSSYLCMALLMYTWLLVFMDSDVYVKDFSSFNHLQLLAIICLSLAVLLESSISCFNLGIFKLIWVFAMCKVYSYIYIP